MSEPYRCWHQDSLCDGYGCPDDPNWHGDMGGYRPVRIEEKRMEDKYKWIWPFPRFRYWLRTGIWCVHPAWSSWQMINTGMQQVRWCEYCDKAQTR